MLAKRFFYVCAGLLCLAVAYHLGIRSARAQTAGQVVNWGSFDPDTDPCGVDSSFRLWLCDRQTGVPSGPFDMPRQEPVVAVTADGRVGAFEALYPDGDAYVHNDTGWHRVGNVFGGSPTPARQSSWGAVKVLHR